MGGGYLPDIGGERIDWGRCLTWDVVADWGT